MNRLIGMTLMLGLATGLSAQTVTLGTASTGPGGSANLSVQFNPAGASISGLQYDFLYDSTKFTITATIGAAATAAGKNFVTSTPAAGDLRVIVVGIGNQTAIGAGDVTDLAISVPGSTAPATYPITISTPSASDPNGVPVALTATSGSLTVLAILTVNAPASLPVGTVGTPYSSTVTATGGTGPYTFTATGLPAGLTISSGGAITGTPTTTTGSPFAVVVTVKDSANPVGTATKNYTLTINPVLSISGPATLPSGTAGGAYTSTTVTATGGSGTGYTFTAPGLPAGMTIGASTGIISGTPTGSFNGNVTVTVTDSAAGTANKVYPLVINGPLGISGPATIGPATVSAPFTVTIQGSGGSGTYTWTATGLPAGLSIAPTTGIISGTPTTNSASPYSVTVTVADGTGATVPKTYSLVVNPALTVTAPASLPNGTINVVYAGATATATGGSGTYTWSATGLPAGLSISPTTGAISGTPTASGAGLSVVIKATDANSVTATKTLSLTIFAALTVSGPAALPGATSGTAYPSTTVTATGGSGTYNWTATGLPTGLTIAPTTGVISGTTSLTAGSPFSVTVTVTDTATPANTATKAYTLAVNPPPTVSGPATLPVATVNAAYTATTVTATGGTSPITWSATGLPAGLTIAPTTGVISGIPTSNAGSPLSVVVTATDVNTAKGTKTYTLTVNPALVISGPASLPVGIPTVAYTATTITATGGAGAPYTWSATGLPTGLTINASTGVISGTPTSNTGSPFTVVVTVKDSNLVTATKTYTLAVAPPLSISGPASIPSAVVNVQYTITQVTASGGSGSYTFTATGLPNGLSISSTGLISGTPLTNTASPYTVVVTVTDTNGSTAKMTYSLPISALPLTITSGPLPTGVLNAPYPYTSITAQGGVGAYTYTVTGLPPGLTTDGSGDITGTPTSNTNSPYSIVVTITDTTGTSVSRTYSLAISGVLTVVTPATLPAATLNTAYTPTTVTAGGGLAPFTWAATGLPAGMTINIATGVISGTPTSAAGSPYSVVVTVTDSTGAKSNKTYSLVVNATGPALSISGPATLPSAMVSVAYPSTTITATGGSGTYTWSATGLPSGLSIAPSTGAITGTPSANAAGPYTVVVTVTDSSSATATKSYSLTVNPGTTGVPLIASISTTAGPGSTVVAPNTWVSIYGSNFTAAGFTDTWTTAITSGNGNLPTTLDGVSVMFGTSAAYVEYVSATQINVLLPNVGLGPLSVVVTTAGGGPSAAFMINSQATIPGIFPWPNNQPVATHQDFTYAVANGTFTGTTTVPAAPGETIVLWGSGFGPTTPAIPYGAAVPTGTTYTTSNNVSASINGAPATVYQNTGFLTASNAGLYQVGVTVPSGLANGTYPVTITVNGVTSPALMLTVHN